MTTMVASPRRRMFAFLAPSWPSWSLIARHREAYDRMCAMPIDLKGDLMVWYARAMFLRRERRQMLWICLFGIILLGRQQMWSGMIVALVLCVWWPAYRQEHRLYLKMIKRCAVHDAAMARVLGMQRQAAWTD